MLMCVTLGREILIFQGSSAQHCYWLRRLQMLLAAQYLASEAGQFIFSPSSRLEATDNFKVFSNPWQFNVNE